MSTDNLCFEQEYEKYQNFLSENFRFLVVKFSIHLNRLRDAYFFLKKKMSSAAVVTSTLKDNKYLFCLFVLRFNDPVNPMESCQARSVYLTTLLLGRHSPQSG